MSSLGLLEEVGDELWGETESTANWLGEASTDDSELFSGVWSLKQEGKGGGGSSHTEYYTMFLFAFDFKQLCFGKCHLFTYISVSKRREVF